VASHAPLLIGLTGSIGMGKSETAKMFARAGVPVYDADATVEALYAKGGEAVGPVSAAFPKALHDGSIDRAALSEIVTDDRAALRRLEEIVHPLVRKKRERFIERAARAGAALVVLDIPLLFETGSECEVDIVVVVSAPEEIQRARVLAREGMSEEKFAALLARQVPDAEKRAKADFVIDTGKGLAHAEGEVQAIIAAVKNRRS
jgi:dephospho-CoA kinase